MEAERAAIKAAFNEGATLSNDGKSDEAIAKFNEVHRQDPEVRRVLHQHRRCSACARRTTRPRPPTRRRSSCKPNFGEAYNGLANVYNAQKKFDLAAEASEQATKLRRRRRCRRRHRRRQRRRGLQPGRHRSGTPARSPRPRSSFEQAVRLDPEAGRRALLARHGDRERGQAARRRRSRSRST